MIPGLSRFALLLALFAVCAEVARAEAPAHIGLTPLQIQRAGITVERAVSASTSAGEVRLSGRAVLPNQAVQVASTPLSGTVEAIEANTMQEVASGRVLARLYSPQLLEAQRGYVQAQAQARLAAAKLKRDERLFGEGIISENRLQESRNAHTQAAVAARERRQVLGLAGASDAGLDALAAGGPLSPRLTVRAPARGMVLELLATPGQRLDAGAPIAKIGRMDRLRLELQAAREQVAQIAVGSSVTVAGCGQPGRISAIGAQIDASTQAVIVRAELPGAGQCLRLNQYVEAAVSTHAPARGAVSLPASALVRHGGRDYVFVREPDGFRPLAVTVQGPRGARIAVSAALTPGAEVAVSGLTTLKGAWLGLGAAAPAQSAAPGAPGAK